MLGRGQTTGECPDCGKMHAPDIVCQMRRLRERIEVLEDQVRLLLRALRAEERLEK